MSATLYLPGVGKTTLARALEQAHGAVRLTPDEWMVPLFGLRWTEPDGKRAVLEGRLGLLRPPSPEPFETWPAWAADRSPSLPRLDR